jgi:RNA polymerase I-specific transcription initiation factor RRN3
MGSFLSRAKYVPITTCVATLQLMVTWLHNYIEKTCTNKPNGSISTINYLDLHRTFYSLCQTVFYVIIFRNRQLFQSHNVTQNNNHPFDKNKEKDYSNLVRSWKLNEIVTSKLNPLRYCLRSIRKKFARIAYINQIAYCYSIIDANNRLTIPISGQTNNGMFFSNPNDTVFLNESAGDINKLNKKSIEKRFDSNAIADNPLDSFFPFDPYLLNRSRIYVLKFYQEFQNVIDDDMELDDSDSDDDDDDDEDEEEEDGDDEDDEDDEEEDEPTEDEKNIRYDLERELRDESDNDDENKNNLKLNRFTFKNNYNLNFSNGEDD